MVYFLTLSPLKGENRMANIQERRDKHGKLISYSIRVHRGRGPDGKQLKPYTATFEVSPTWTEKSARKKAEAFAATFEEKCKTGISSDCRLTFQQYTEYVLELKERRGDKHTTLADYKTMTPRIFSAIGPIKLRDLRPAHLNDFYAELAKEGANKRTGGKLSNTTILRYHRLISIVLSQAVKEGLIAINPASRAEPPKADKKDPNYIQAETIPLIFEALKTEPIMWQALVNLLFITGCRRGEILGLKWQNVDLDNYRLYICNTISYTSDRGIYESTPKTKSSVRYISIPAETTQMLRQYKLWQTEEILRLGTYYQRNDYLFSQDNGQPMRPDSVTQWLSKFSRRHRLPHLNPHAFRHTMTSMLIFGGMDTVSVSKRLGHSQVSTTTDIYAHTIAEADRRNADLLGEILLKRAL